MLRKIYFKVFLKRYLDVLKYLRMERKTIIKTSRLLLDIIGLISPLVTAGFSLTPIFLATNFAHLIQFTIVGYFLTIFLVKLIAFLIHYRNNEEDIYKRNIKEAKISIVSGYIMLLEMIGIYFAFIYIIFQQPIKGFFASSIAFATIYTVMFLGRLVLNLYTHLTKKGNENIYEKTLTYIGTITVLYVMVVSFNYLAHALELRVKILELIVAIISLILILIIAIRMIVFGHGIIRYNKKQARKEIRVLKKETNKYFKEMKVKKKETDKYYKQVKRSQKRGSKDV